MEEEKKESAEVNQQAKAQELIKKINDILAEEGYVLVPTLTIIGNQVIQNVQIAPKPKEKKILTPEK